MRPSPERATTTPSSATGGASTSPVNCAFHICLPCGSNASTSPREVPAKIRPPPAPTPPDRRWPEGSFVTAPPFAASNPVMLPAAFAVYTTLPTRAG